MQHGGQPPLVVRTGSLGAASLCVEYPRLCVTDGSSVRKVRLLCYR